MICLLFSCVTDLTGALSSKIIQHGLPLRGAYRDNNVLAILAYELYHHEKDQIFWKNKGISYILTKIDVIKILNNSEYWKNAALNKLLLVFNEDVRKELKKVSYITIGITTELVN